MGRMLMVWCALSISCGSDKATNEQTAAAPAPTELAVPTPVEAAPPPPSQQRERDATSVQCRRGEVEACATAATLSAELGDEAGARRHQELGCLHGSAAACRALAPVSAHWLGAACRRGDEEACRNASRPRASKFRLTAPRKGPVGARVRATYAASIEDCAVRHDTGDGAIAATFSVREGHVVDVATTPASGGLASCVRAAIEQWVFLEPGADGGPHEVRARFQTARAQLEAEAEAFAMLLLGEGESSGVGNIVSRNPGTNLGADLDRQISEVKDTGAGVTLGGPSTRGTATGDVRGPRQGTAIGPSGHPKMIDPPSALIRISSAKVFDPSTLTTDELTAKIKRQYIAGLKRCYERRLKVDPTATATARLTFTIQASGRTSQLRAAAKPPDAELAACLRGLAASWRFSIPRDDAGDPTDVDVAIELTLGPR